MRIVTHVRSLERLGGIEVNTLEATRALVARGHEVHVLHGPLVTGGTVPGTRAGFEAAGAVLHGPFPFQATVLTSPLRVRGFLPAAQLVRQLAPDLLWLQRTELVIWGQTVARLSGTPLVSHVHHVVNYGRALPWLTHGVVRFIAVSSYIRERWVESGVRRDLVDVVPNAVPPESYPPGRSAELVRARTALGLPADVPIALYYGRLEEGKGLGVTLDAWARLSSRPDGAHLVLAGDLDDAEEHWRPRIAAAQATGTVTVLPAQQDVVPLLHAADVVLFPTLLPESFGRVAVEALMTHRPVLASAVGAVPEVLSGPLTRFLLPPGDASAWAPALDRLLTWRRDEPGLGEELGAEASRRFSFDAYVTALEASLGAAAVQRDRRRPGRRG